MDSQLPEIFETIIIGGGAAGITAAIYAVRKNLEVLMLTKNIGGQAALSGDIENYPGYSMISGEELTRKFKAELLSFEGKGLWVKEGVEVTDISGATPNFLVKTVDGKEYHCKTVIIASGRTPRMLGISGEKELLGRGVSTCATNNSPFFKDKDVAVVGGGNCALDAASSLIKVARSVTIINITESLRGDEVLLKNVTSSEKVKVLNDHEAVAILGEASVGGIKIRNNQTKEEQVMPVSGVFIEIGWIPSVPFDKLTEKNEKGEIKVNQFGASSVPGIFACGDINDQAGEQIVIAAGEGAKTALKAAEYISKIPG
ncbi:MAG: FAD-dependent oxidoreductase [bacterium]|nr:FAD-dependent oxidoreductase [bacterium]